MDIMAHNPSNSSIFNAILPFLAKHNPKLLHETPADLPFDDLIAHVCGELNCDQPKNWKETSDLIGKIINGK
jgi:hypothetical protein|tara:strand:- start:227 stop:442 length:216 start_codon:yes stop_codon:yes gene_type:complete